MSSNVPLAALLALLLAACGGLVGDGEDEPAAEPAPTTEEAPGETPVPDCQTGMRRCSGAVRQFCDRDGVTWTTIETCLTAERCDPTHCKPEGAP